MIKYSFIMPYYRRASQFRRTLETFDALYKTRTDYEIVVVEDVKNLNSPTLHQELIDIINNRQYPVILITGVNLKSNQAGPAHNFGVARANGEFMILTNPEILHETDVLKGLDEEFGKDPGVYVVCACKSLRQDGSFNTWYQHSVHRNERFHFCNALHKKTFEKVGGVNEAFAEGYGFEDNDFRDKLFYKGVKFVIRDDLITAHQWHEAVPSVNHKEGWDRNKKLWLENVRRYMAESGHKIQIPVEPSPGIPLNVEAIKPGYYCGQQIPKGGKFTLSDPQHFSAKWMKKELPFDTVEILPPLGDNVRITALCKTWRGHEWLRPMALAIYPYVEKIVFVNSEVSWIGRKGNTCKAEIAKLPQDKIISLNYDTMNQIEQVKHGFKYIKHNLKPDYVMMVDTDEIWDRADMERALAFIKAKPNMASYRVRMTAYVKSPFYQIQPDESGKPVSFINMRRDTGIIGIRGGNTPPSIVIPDVKFHHFCYVRESFNTVLEKIFTSHISEDTQFTDMSHWIPEVWNKLPNVKMNGGFHPLIGHHGKWQRVAEVTREDLPEVLSTKSFPIMEGHKT